VAGADGFEEAGFREMKGDEEEEKSEHGVKERRQFKREKCTSTGSCYRYKVVTVGCWTENGWSLGTRKARTSVSPRTEFTIVQNEPSAKPFY